MNPGMPVDTKFANPCEPTFVQHVASEKPPFILADCSSTFSQLYILQYSYLGLDFAKVEGLKTSLVEIMGWYYSLPTRIRPLKVKGPPYQPVKEVVVKCEVFSWNCLVDLSEQAQSDGVRSILLLMAIAQALKPYIGLADRLQNISPQVNVEMSQQLQNSYILLLQSGVIVANPSEVCDLIDELFLCQILSFLREMPETEKELFRLDFLTQCFPLAGTRLEQAITNLESLSQYMTENCHSITNISQLLHSTAAWKITCEVKEVPERPIAEEVHVLERLGGPLYEEYTKEVVTNVDFEFGDDLDNKSFVKDFREKYHWHCLKKLTDEYQRIPAANSTTTLRGKQKSALFQVRYGISLEGEITIDKPIVVADKSKADKKKSGGSETAKASIMLEEFGNKLEAYRNEVKSFIQIKEVKTAIEKCEKKYKDCRSKFESLRIPTGEKKVSKKDKKKANFQQMKEDLSKEMIAIFVNPLMKFRLKELDALESIRPNLSIDHRIQVLQTAKKILSYDGELDEKMSTKLGKYLKKCGFVKLAKELNLIGDDHRSKKDGNVPEESLARFQMMHMGPYMEVESPKEKDPRVDAFNPDLWQRELFDVVDKRGSALIVAPTSSGKTFASYYCMESVLRESDDGVVVYVSPTKALVNQITATVCARFSKRKSMPSGMSVYGVFTRDFRQDAMECQILITVPECLEVRLVLLCHSLEPRGTFCQFIPRFASEKRTANE